MGRELLIFLDYHQNQNNLTNHCGVLLRQIYCESPKQFEDPANKSHLHPLVIPLVGCRSVAGK